jgi:WD40 repeat protein
MRFVYDDIDRLAGRIEKHRIGLSLAALCLAMLCAPWSGLVFAFGDSQAIRESRFDIGSGVQGLAISPDSQSVALYTSTLSNGDEIVSEIQIWDWREVKVRLRRVISRRKPVDISRYSIGQQFVRYADSGKKLVICQDGNVLVLDSSTLQELRNIDLRLEPYPRRGQPGSSDFSRFLDVTDVEVSSNNQRVAILLNLGITENGELRIYDIGSGTLLRKWTLTQTDQRPSERNQSKSVFDLSLRVVSIDASGNKVALASGALQIDGVPPQSRENTVRIFDIDSGKETREIAIGPLPGVARFVSSHPLVVATVPVGVPSYPLHSLKKKEPKQYALSLWNAETGERIFTISSPPGGAHDFLDVSENGRIAMGYISYSKCGFFVSGVESGCADYDNRFRLWDLTTGKAILTSPALGRKPGLYFDREVDHIMLSPRGDLVVTWTLGSPKWFKPCRFYQVGQ